MSYRGDISIHVHHENSPRHVLNGGPKDASFPGWFVRVYSNEGYEAVYPLDMPERQITEGEALAIAEALDVILSTKGRVRQAFLGVISDDVRALEAQVTRAESSAQSLPALKQRLEEARKRAGESAAPHPEQRPQPGERS